MGLMNTCTMAQIIYEEDALLKQRLNPVYPNRVYRSGSEDYPNVQPLNLRVCFEIDDQCHYEHMHLILICVFR